MVYNGFDLTKKSDARKFLIERGYDINLLLRMSKFEAYAICEGIKTLKGLS